MLTNGELDRIDNHLSNMETLLGDLRNHLEELNRQESDRNRRMREAFTESLEYLESVAGDGDG